MRALAAAGDAPGALRHAEIFHQIRRDELELPPDPAVEALAERIRRGEEAPRRRGKLAPPGSNDARRSEHRPAPAETPFASQLPARARRCRLPAPRLEHPTRDAAARGWFSPRSWQSPCCCCCGARTHRSAAETAGPRRLAVLPFENLGDSGDAYFADGVTDEVRGKLAAMPGLEVVASLSSNEYRGSTRRLAGDRAGAGGELPAGREDPLASGRGRLEPGAGEPGADPVSAPGAAPTTRWQQPIDAALTDVFAVQADIAAKVADALGVVLGDSARRELTVKPTESLAAYDEFLKGEAASQGMKADQAGLRRAIGFYERAVSLDSTFAAGLEPALPGPDLALLERRARPGAGRRGAGRGRAGARAPARAIRWSISPPAISTAASTRSTTSAPWRSTSTASVSRRTTWTCSARAAMAGASLGRWDGVAARLERAPPARSALDHGGAPAGHRAASSSGSTPPPTRRPTGRSPSRRPVPQMVCSR